MRKLTNVRRKETFVAITYFGMETFALNVKIQGNSITKQKYVSVQKIKLTTLTIKNAYSVVELLLMFPALSQTYIGYTEKKVWKDMTKDYKKSTL